MKAIIGAYANGNVNVILFDDGTKLRISAGETQEPELFESVDLKITNKCAHNCPYCYEASTVDGMHANIEKFKMLFDTMHPFTEIAIGGGNPLLYPRLDGFLQQCSVRSLVPNLTINYKDLFTALSWLKDMRDKKLLYGIGVSMPIDKVDWTDYLLETIRSIDGVMHCIVGLVTEEQLRIAANRGMKVLFLGYKHSGRGLEFLHTSMGELVMSDQEILNMLPEMINDGLFRVISFDNLAIHRCTVRDLLNAETFNRVYMGDDGEFTMYIDLVSEQFAESSSCNAIRYRLLPDYTAKDVWDIVRNRKKGILA